MNYLWLISIWTLYFFLHSFLASNSVKNWCYAHVKLSVRAYRFLYSLFSGLGLIYLLFLMLIIPSHLLFIRSTAIGYLALVFASWGVILVMVSFRHLSITSFLGFSKGQETELIKTGLHAHVRHPIYSGVILIVIGMWLYNPTDTLLTAAICILVYLPVGIFLEEQKLLQAFGDQYNAYQQEVPAIFPKLF